MQWKGHGYCIIVLKRVNFWCDVNKPYNNYYLEAVYKKYTGNTVILSEPKVGWYRV